MSERQSSGEIGCKKTGRWQQYKESEREREKERERKRDREREQLDREQITQGRARQTDRE